MTDKLTKDASFAQHLTPFAVVVILVLSVASVILWDMRDVFTQEDCFTRPCTRQFSSYTPPAQVAEADRFARRMMAEMHMLPDRYNMFKSDSSTTDRIHLRYIRNHWTGGGAWVEVQFYRTTCTVTLQSTA